jgi:transmembrane sensor
MNDSFADQSAKQDPAVTEQAFAWFVRLHSAGVSNAERTEFERWLDRDTRHRQAYEEAQRLWRDRRLVQALRKTRPRPSATRFPGVRVLRPAAVLGLVLICVAGTFLDPVMRWQADYQTGTGERQSIGLADGSRLILAPHTAVALASTGTRQVRLLNGEVYCEVRPDPDRPFVVLGPHSHTQVLGTRFSVRARDAADVLTVAEGRVEFSRAGQTREGRIVQAGEQASTDGNRLSQTAMAAARQVLAWTGGTLVLEQTPFAEVLERIRPCHRGLLWLRDDSLRDFPVSGRFDLGDSNRLLDTLAETLPIRVARITLWLVIVLRK